MSVVSDEICVEIICYLDTIPAIKSYYILSKKEYDDLKMLHIDIFIPDFINNETITKDKLDIIIITNEINIKHIKDFINIFGNPFDIIDLIYKKKIIHDQEQQITQVNEQKIYDNFESSESDDYIATMTDIIDTYNKTGKPDKAKIIKLKKTNPELNDEIINELDTK